MATPNLALPGNPRYQPKSLVPYFGYDNNFRFLARVEIAAMETLGEIGVIPAEDIALLDDEAREKILSITTTEVDARERTVTKHDVRAWVQLAQARLPEPLRRWVHVPLTSYDALDTARALQFMEAHENVVKPLVVRLADILSAKIAEHARTVQIGRTHGQHALPITVGFWLATILSRIVANATEMDRFTLGLRGKISGAVGAYNAQAGLGILDKCGPDSFEELVLRKLRLKPATISTQVLPPEPLAYYLFSATMLSASLGQLGRDCRHLMRTEIGEIGEPFDAGQVGSSTMAHKRNPINFENLEGTAQKAQIEFQKVFATLTSEHQRDLVGSSILRDLPTIVVDLVCQLETLLRRKDESSPCFIERIRVDEEACKRNFALQSHLVMAEPIYIALQMAGYSGDAHELVNHRAMPLATENRLSLVWALERLELKDEAVKAALGRIPEPILELLEAPERYIGRAAEVAMEVAARAHMYCSPHTP